MILNILDCECHKDGSVNSVCNQDGICTCKDDVEGDRCSRCKPNHFGFPSCQGKIWPFLSKYLKM